MTFEILRALGECLRVGVYGLDLLQLLLRDAADLQQLLRVVFQHIERICTEPLDNASGRAFSDAFEQAR